MKSFSSARIKSTGCTSPPAGFRFVKSWSEGKFARVPGFERVGEVRSCAWKVSRVEEGMWMLMFGSWRELEGMFRPMVWAWF
jgi:hypothetical protein